MKLFLTGSAMLCMICSIAQDRTDQSPAFKLQATGNFQTSEGPQFSPDSALYLLTNGARGGSSAKVFGSSKDRKGLVHYRSHQMLNGVRIENAVFLQKVSNGKIVSTSGHWLENLPEKSSGKPALSESTALRQAIKFSGNPAQGTIKSRPAGLVYYSPDNDNSSLKLAYKFDIYVREPLSRNFVYIDAASGNLLGEINRIHSFNVAATGATALSGTREIITDFSDGVYRLRDYSRGMGIFTFNLRRFADYSNAVDFTNSTTSWNLTNSDLDQFAVDVHWNTEKTFDYFFSRFNRNSIDDNGFALKSYVHYGVNFQNAFWDGERMSYGDGFNKPYTTLDLCGHEIAHGLTQFTSGLLYKNESGALNEGLSDIFGTAIEQYARPEKWDWRIGGDQSTQRDLSNPKEFLQPTTYKGTYWYTGADQDQFIHRNSSVLGYWFYLLTNGGSGTNDLGNAYVVNGIGMDKAAAIAYYMNIHYLFPDAGYMDALFGSLQAAEDLYGDGAPEVLQTANAWAAVGLVLKPAVPKIAASSHTICSGTSSTLTITGGSLNSGKEWRWYSGACGGTYIASGLSITVSPKANTVYYVRGEGTLSGSGICAGLQVVVNPAPPLPVVTSSEPLVIAQGKSITLNAPLGYQAYEWNNGQTTASISVNTAGDYSVRVTNANGCVSQGSFPVHVLQRPESPPVIMAPLDSALCSEPDKTYILPALNVVSETPVDESRITFQVTGATVRSGTGSDASGFLNDGASTITWKLAGINEEFVTVVNVNPCNAGSGWPNWQSTLAEALEKIKELLNALHVKVTAYPNPSTSSFKLVITAKSGQQVTIIVRDYTGRVIEVKYCAGNSIVDLGSNYRTGIYFAEVIQGKEHLTVKLIRF